MKNELRDYVCMRTDCVAYVGCSARCRRTVVPVRTVSEEADEAAERIARETLAEDRP